MATTVRSDDVITLRTVLAVLLERWRWIGACALALALVGVALGFLLPPKYRAEAVVTAASKENQSALSRMAGSFGSISSLLGLSVGGGQDSQEVVATLTSRTLIQKLIETRNLMPVLFEDDWDAQRKAWKDPDEAPTLWGAIEFFRESVLVVLLDPQTSLITVRIDWGDPALASQWVNDLIKLADDTLRARSLARSQGNLTYLRGEYEKTQTIELQAALAQLIQVEMQTIMVASGGSEYAVRSIDPAYTADEPVSPRKVLLVAVFAMLGGTLAVAVVGVRALNSFK